MFAGRPRLRPPDRRTVLPGWHTAATVFNLSFPRSFLLISLYTILLLTCYGPVVADAQVINGQFFTEGLAISDSPLPGQTFNAGGNIPLAVEVSGDGRLPSNAYTLGGSSVPTEFISLDVFLISSTSNLNATISTGNELLAGEPGSTVKHLSWPIPTCLPDGEYNVTLYETSLINGLPFFTVTPIGIYVENPRPSGSPGNCPGVSIESPPSQDDDSLGFSPFLNPNFTFFTDPPSQTYHLSRGGAETTIVLLPGDLTETVTILVTATGSAGSSVATGTLLNGDGLPILSPVNHASALQIRSLPLVLVAGVLFLLQYGYFGG